MEPFKPIPVYKHLLPVTKAVFCHPIWDSWDRENFLKAVSDLWFLLCTALLRILVGLLFPISIPLLAWLREKDRKLTYQRQVEWQRESDAQWNKLVRKRVESD